MVKENVGYVMLDIKTARKSSEQVDKSIVPSLAVEY